MYLTIIILPLLGSVIWGFLGMPIILILDSVISFLPCILFCVDISDSLWESWINMFYGFDGCADGEIDEWWAGIGDAIESIDNEESEQDRGQAVAGAQEGEDSPGAPEGSAGAQEVQEVDPAEIPEEQSIAGAEEEE